MKIENLKRFAYNPDSGLWWNGKTGFDSFAMVSTDPAVETAIPDAAVFLFRMIWGHVAFVLA